MTFDVMSTKPHPPCSPKQISLNIVILYDVLLPHYSIRWLSAVTMTTDTQSLSLRIFNVNPISIILILMAYPHCQCHQHHFITIYIINDSEDTLGSVMKSICVIIQLSYKVTDLYPPPCLYLIPSICRVGSYFLLFFFIFKYIFI